MDKTYLALLLKKHQDNLLSARERLDLHNWYLNLAKSSLPLRDAEVYKRLLTEMDNAFPFVTTAPVKTRRIWPGIAAAASLLLVLGLGLFYIGQKQADQRFAKTDIAPGRNTAVLTFSNGKTISLSEAKAGVIIDAAALTYNDGTPIHPKGNGVYPSEMTSLTTPRGGQYQVTLSDGTKVWLNAASSLKFPSSFANVSKREVLVTGEAYFEVAKDKAHPFIVRTQKQELEVLGTHFNVTSYAEEGSTRTTLIEGRVKISRARGSSALSRGQKNIILKPGQQSEIDNDGLIQVKQVDTEDAIAWKNGLFVFEDEPLEKIMYKVSRWYDVTIVYDGADRNKLFGGTVSRYDHISKVLEKLELTGGVHFEIIGKKVIARE